MKLLKTAGDAFTAGRNSGAGEAHVLPEDIEDLWHAFNLILVGDTVTAATFRKVKTESATGSVDSQRVRVRMQLEVRAVDFDPEGGELRLSGVVLSEHDGIRLGSRHTLELEVGRAFTLHKPDWNALSLQRLREACDSAVSSAEVAALLMQHGLATLCLLSGGMSIVRARVEAHIPKKGSAVMLASANRAAEKWQEQVLQAVLRHLELNKLRCVILAGPGFVKDGFYAWLFAEAARRELKDLLTSRPKWVVCHASSGHKHALKEVLADPSVATRIADTKAAGETRALAAFNAMLAAQPERVTYGPRHVEFACEQGALEKLLITDSLFRAPSVSKRARYVALAEAARAAGAVVHVFSSLHVSGEQLDQLSGVAAILRFPLGIECESEDEDEEVNQCGGPE